MVELYHIIDNDCVKEESKLLKAQMDITCCDRP
jgi:hypothetical protein